MTVAQCCLHACMQPPRQCQNSMPCPCFITLPPPLPLLLQARNFAVMTGVNSGVAAFMKRWRGKDDVQNQLVGEALLPCFVALLGGSVRV